jgi:hypothetical protein
MRHAPHYQVCSLETDRRALPLIDFNDSGLDCKMFVLSAHAAKLIVTWLNRPFDGIAVSPWGGPLKVTAIEYVIVCERSSGKFESQSYRHGFKRPATLAGDTLSAAPNKLFMQDDLGLLLNRMRKSSLGPKVNAREFRGIKAIQFIA